MSTWNCRVLAIEHNGDIYLRIHEVYYNKQGVADGYTAAPASIGGETIEEVKEYVLKINTAIEKPILWAGDKFPQEYNPATNKK